MKKVINPLSKELLNDLTCNDYLTLEELKPLLNTKFIGNSIYYFDTIDSTNTYAKSIGTKSNNGALVISEEQTVGRGRLGRSFMSPKHKGIWMSIILKPNINPKDAAKLTQVAAASVASAINELGIDTKVKWPNDILLNDKKLCGILTELSVSASNINYVIVGIGLNVNLAKDDFNEDIKDNATSLMIESGELWDRKRLLASILNHFEALYIKFTENNDFKASLDICIENSALIGQEILVINRDSIVKATALGIDEEGKLIVQYDNGTYEHLISGEVSIRKRDCLTKK